MTDRNDKDLKVTVLGLGAIGAKVVRGLDRPGIPGLRLGAVSARDAEHASRLVEDLRRRPSVLALEDAVAAGDVVVECLPPALFDRVATTVLTQGRTLVACSVGALMGRPDLLELAARHGGRVYVPSGALAGLDGIQAAVRAGIDSASLVTEKPVSGFQQSEYLDARGICLDGLRAPTVLFEGAASEGVRLFPRNVNVAGALCLAGIDPQRLGMTLWADPALAVNRHTVTVSGPAGRMRITVENQPDPENPRTSGLTAHSVLATLQRVVSRLVI